MCPLSGCGIRLTFNSMGEHGLLDYYYTHEAIDKYTFRAWENTHTHTHACTHTCTHFTVLYS